MFTPATRMNLGKNEKTAWETLARAGNATQRTACRCRVILLAAQGTPKRAMARQVGVSRPTVSAVRAAYVRGGVALRRTAKQHGRNSSPA
jgi:transposase